MADRKFAAIVLAAGEGKRMQSDLPKPLHEIAGKPLILYTLETLKTLDLGHIIVVLKHKAEQIKPVVSPYADTVVQGNAYGTAKAVEAALASLESTILDIIVVNADNAMFITTETYQKLVAEHRRGDYVMTLATREVEDPFGIGRIVRNEHGGLAKIVEEKDATESEKRITEVNTGTYVLQRTWLTSAIKAIEQSPVTKEYYLTDLVAIAAKEGKQVNSVNFGKTDEWFEITTQEDVRHANERIEKGV